MRWIRERLPSRILRKASSLLASGLSSGASCGMATTSGFAIVASAVFDGGGVTYAFFMVG